MAQQNISDDQLLRLASTKDEEGKTLVLHAVERGDLLLVKFLLEKGARLIDKDNEGRTSLSFAVQEGNIELARYLLQCDPTLLQMGREEARPLAIAEAQNDRKMKEFLSSYLEIA